MSVYHPTAKMLVELSQSQDVEAGDGTTSVCVIAGSLLNACQSLLDKGIHPTAISEAFMDACHKVCPCSCSALPLPPCLATVLPLPREWLTDANLPPVLPAPPLCLSLCLRGTDNSRTRFCRA